MDAATRTQTTDPYAPLLEVRRPSDVEAVRQALTEADIPYRSGLLAAQPPRVIFSVPREHLDDAWAMLGPAFPSAAATARPEPDARFPWTHVLSAAALVVVHLGLVAAGGGGRELLAAGGVLGGAMLAEPWRLVTSLFLHVDVRHVLANGVSMLVFAIPLLFYLGYARSLMIYFAAGVGGAAAAAAFAAPGGLIVGSSGAVAGLFGAWVVVTFRLARLRDLGWRGKIRTAGIALLVLPSLVTPVTSSGQSVSVSSHIGGLLTGMLVGAVISGGLLAHDMRQAEEAR